jgi:hypothetical protein
MWSKPSGGLKRLSSTWTSISNSSAFFEWLEAAAARNAERNVGLSDEEVLAIIEQAREQVASAAR